MSLQFATKRLIDSVWTLGFKWVDGGVEIVSYDRESDVGYKYEKDLLQAHLIEDENRTVIAVQLRQYEQFNMKFVDVPEFTVVNPKHVFSYK
jgi:hypothetical protein